MIEPEIGNMNALLIQVPKATGPDSWAIPSKEIIIELHEDGCLRVWDIERLPEKAAHDQAKA